MAFYLISQQTTYKTNMPGLCLPSDQTVNLAVYTSLKTAYEQGLHYFNQIKLEDEIDYSNQITLGNKIVTYSLDNIKDTLIDDSIATIGQETIVEYVPADPKYSTHKITRIVLQKFQKDIYLY